MRTRDFLEEAAGIVFEHFYEINSYSFSDLSCSEIEYFKVFTKMLEAEKSERFSDGGELVYEFGDEFLVVCPRCAGKARVFRVEIGSEKLGKKLNSPRKLICFSCVYRNEWNGGKVTIGGKFDWYFGFPLWLEVSCCGKTLWAYNQKHLEFIENYVAAKIRSRLPNKNKSLASRLPSWIKQAKNRAEVLKAVGKLKDKLPANRA